MTAASLFGKHRKQVAAVSLSRLFDTPNTHTEHTVQIFLQDKPVE